MNTRERFLAVMNFQPTDRTLRWEHGYWAGTVRRWYEEGLPSRTGIPETLADADNVRGGVAPWDEVGRPKEDDVRDFFGLDPGIRRIPLNTYLCPHFENRVLEDHGSWVLRVDENGVILKDRKDRATLPQFVRCPVATRDDWEALKAERLRPNVEARLPADWEQIRTELRKRDYPLAALGGGVGFFGTLRNLMGPEKLMIALIDDPYLIHDIVDYLADLWITLTDQVLNQIDADLALFWEDMCYKTGPLISPAMFREFILPGYRKVTSFLRSRGIKIIHVDTDGNCWSLLPLFIEGGVTGLWPFEVNAGMDVVSVRNAFPKLQILGGLDKTKLAADPAAIDAELDRKVPQLIEKGGYVPAVDHVVPPDISWGNFVYYRQRLDGIIREHRTAEQS